MICACQKASLMQYLTNKQERKLFTPKPQLHHTYTALTNADRFVKVYYEKVIFHIQDSAHLAPANALEWENVPGGALIRATKLHYTTVWPCLVSWPWCCYAGLVLQGAEGLSVRNGLVCKDSTPSSRCVRLYRDFSLPPTDEYIDIEILLVIFFIVSWTKITYCFTLIAMVSGKSKAWGNGYIKTAQ